MQPTLYFILAASSTAYWIGRGFFAFLMLMAVIKCYRISRRPTTNTASAFSLSLFFWMLIINALLGSVFSDESTSAPVKLFFFALVFGLGIVALVFAVIGLVEISKDKERFTQGKSQAIWAIVLFVSWFLIVGLIITKRVNEGLEYVSENQVAAGSPMDVEEFNLRFIAPEKPWVQIDARKVNEEACLAFVRTRPRIHMIIIAEKYPTDTRLDTAAIAEVMKGNLRSASREVKLVEEKPARFGNLVGVRMRHDTVTNGKKLTFQQWTAARNGFCYQFHLYGDLKSADTIHRQADYMFKRFALIDPDRSVSTVAGRPVSEFRSDRFGYAVKLEDPGWSEWEDFHEHFPEAEFGVKKGDAVRFGVVPVSLMGTDPDLDALSFGLLSTMNIDYRNEEFIDEHDISVEGCEGRVFTYEREVDGTPFHYRMKVLRRENLSLLLSSWTLQSYTRTTPWLDRALNGISFPGRRVPVDPDQLSGKDRETHASVLNKIGSFYFKKDRFDLATGYFKLAQGLDPHYAVYLTNAVHSLSNQKRYSDALDHLEKRLDEFEGDAATRSWRPYLLGRLGRNEESVEDYRALFDGGYQNDADFYDYLDRLDELNRHDDAVAAMEKYMAGKETIDLHLRYASLFSNMEDYGRALEILDGFQEGKPFQPRVAYAMDDNYYDAAMYSESIETCNRLIENGVDSPWAYYRRGRSEYELKWYRKSKRSLEEAVKRDPASEKFKEFLEHVSGVLGEGNNLLVKEVIEPVPLPAAVLDGAPAESTMDGGEEHSARYLRKIMLVHFVREKDYRTTYNRRVRVLDTAGVQRFSTIEIRFDPLSEQVHVNGLEVHDESGRLVAEGDVDDYYVIDDTSSGTATHDKVLNVPVSGLSPGCRIDLTYTIRRNGALKEVDYLEYLFSSSTPIGRNACFYSGDTDALAFKASENVRFSERDGGLLWFVDHPARYRGEPYRQDYQEYLPMLWVANKGDTWEGLSREYLGELGDLLEPDDEIRSLSGSLIGGIADEGGKIRKLARFVQDEVTYKAIEFGRRARIPGSPGNILADRYGDCKDHALLFHLLLKAAGIESCLALVNTDGPVQSELPSLEPFNHMIVCIQTPGEELFVDCTDKETDSLSGIPYGEAGSRALLLDPESPRLVTIADYPDDGYQVLSTRTMTLIENGDIQVEEDLEYTGYRASYMRYYFKGIEAGDRVRRFESWMRDGGAALELESLSIEDMDHLERPLKVRTEYVIRNRFHEMDDRLVGCIPCIWEKFHIEMDRVEPRTTPVKLHWPVTVKSRSVFVIPEGWTFEALPPEIGSGEGDRSRWRMTAETSSAGLEIEYEYFIGRGMFPASRYASIQAGAEKALKALERSIVIGKR